MEYRLRYGMDRLEIVPTTGVSVSSAAASGPGVRKDGRSGGEGEAPPTGKTPSGETTSGETPSGKTTSGKTPSGETPSGETEWRKKEELLSSSRESAYSDLETSTDTVVPSEDASKMLDTDMEEENTVEDNITERRDESVFDPEIEKQNEL